MIYYGKQSIDEADIQAVEAVLRSDFLTQGPAVERFERVVANYCGAKHAVAVTNATVSDLARQDGARVLLAWVLRGRRLRVAVHRCHLGTSGVLRRHAIECSEISCWH